MNYLYVISIIVYGIARAIQQAAIFNYKDDLELNEIMDTTGEIHAWGWLEPISLLTAGFSLCWMYSNTWIKNIEGGFLVIVIILLLTYPIYFLPYAIMFNRMRGRKWFNKGHKYVITIFGAACESELPSFKATLFFFIINTAVIIVAFI